VPHGPRANDANDFDHEVVATKTRSRLLKTRISAFLFR
jgi:hypothetical protein